MDQRRKCKANHTRTTALSNSMKLSHARGATQEGRVMVERSDRMWSTGEGNGKPPQYSCLANPMDQGTRLATVQRVVRSQTQLKQLRTTQMEGEIRKSSQKIQEKL